MLQLHSVSILDQAAIDELRSAIVCWYHCESGAPAIHPSSPMSELGGDYAKHLQTFLDVCSFEAFGKRSFTNPLLGLGPYNKWDHGYPETYFTEDQKAKQIIEFELTPDHLTLAKALSQDDRTTPDRPRFEPKRVFNGYTDAPEGAYALLTGAEDGYSLPKHKYKHYEKLHYEMAATIQILLREAIVEPGVYHRFLWGKPQRFDDTHRWERMKEIAERVGDPISRSEFAADFYKLTDDMEIF